MTAKTQDISSSRLLWIAFFFAVASRIYTACATINILHPDEHFQTLEPAFNLATDHALGWLSWEWKAKLRSWIIPYLYSFAIRATHFFWPENGWFAILGCRILTALLSSIMVYQLWRWSRKLGLSLFSQWILLLGIGLSPIWIQFGAATLSDIWAMDMLWILFPWVHALWEKDRKTGASLLLFLPLMFRIQMLAFSIPVAGYLIYRFRSVISTRALLSGLGGILLLQGIFDWITWGEFFKSAIVNFQKNFIEGVASFYGVSPWHEYLANFGNWYGWELVLLIALGILFGAIPRPRRADSHPFVTSAFWGSIAIFIAHCAIAHKETRFIFPALPGLWIGLLYVLDSRISAFGRTLSQTYGARAFVWALTLFMGVSSLFSSAHSSNYPISNMSSLMIAVQQDGGLKKSSERCFLMIGQYWIWTHGEMLQWSKLTYKELKIENVTDSDILACPFTVVLPQNEEKLKVLATGRLEFITRDPRGYALYRRR